MFRSLLHATLVLSLLAGFPLSADAGKSITITPSGGGAVKVAIGTKQQTYYTLSSSGRLRLNVEGPGRLTVMSRIVLSPGASGEKAYGITLREKGGVAGSQKTRSDRSDATLSTGAPLGKLRKLLLRVPPGVHAYEAGLEDAGNASAVVKFQFRAGKPPGSLANLQALSYSRVATAVIKEKLVTYYVSARDRGVQVRVIGPTRLKVSTRLNYDATMKGGQKYGVGVWEGDKRIVLKSLMTSKALAVAYQDWKDVIPGKVAAFTVAVPSGEHRFTFRLEEGMGRTASFRFSIPKKDLKNEN
jgi:hypothetical protein